MSSVPLKEVVGIITEICGRFSYSSMDDLVSRLICRVWMEGIEFNAPSNVRRFVWVNVKYHFMKTAKAQSRRGKLFSEMLGEGEQFGPDWLDTLIAPCQPTQEMAIDIWYETYFNVNFPSALIVATLSAIQDNIGVNK